MGIQHSTQTVQYDETKGIYTINNKKINEQDLTLNEINKFNEQANKTTLGNHDINLLHKYYLRNKMETSNIDFMNIPLKNLFPNCDMTFNDLMITAASRGNIKF